MAFNKVARFVRKLAGGRGRVLSEAEFTQEFLRVLYEAQPDLEATIKAPLHVEVVVPGGKSSDTFLHNAYVLHRQAPKETDDILRSYVGSWLETASAEDPLDPDRIVPVVKDSGWLGDVTATASKRATKQEHVWDELSPGLVVVYAEDTPKSIRYLSVSEVDALAWDRATLMERALSNLKRLLPEVERHGGEGIFMFTAGGDYEASLVLFPDLWNKENIPVRGDFVFAVPTRDLLVVTGSEEPAGLARLKSIVEDAVKNGSYRLSPELFTYAAGSIRMYRGGVRH